MNINCAPLLNMYILLFATKNLIKLQLSNQISTHMNLTLLYLTYIIWRI